MTVEVELRVPFATVEIARFQSSEPADNLLCRPDEFWVDLCLTPRSRNARGCYREHWSSNRFERLGTLFAVPPGETMHARSDGGTAQTSLLCHLQPKHEWFEGELEWTDSRLKASLDVAHPRVCGLSLRIAEELRSPGFASATLVELMVGQLAIELGRYWRAVEEAPACGGLAPWRVRRIDERLREFAKPPTLAELASLCELSVRQLTRGYRTSFQRSIGEALVQARLDQAKRLLATDQSVKSIALEVGFATPSSFIAAFRRATGDTPRVFRQRSSSHPIRR